MTIDPEEITRIGYSASREKMPQEMQDTCCPPWDEMELEQRAKMVEGTKETIDILNESGYDIVKKS